MSVPDSPRVVLADDHVLFREALAALLPRDGFTVVGEASDGDTAVVLVAEHQPDVALLDVQMPGPGPVALVEQVRTAAPETRVVMLSMHAPAALVAELQEAGISGYFVKSIGRRSLAAGLVTVLAGGDMVTLIPKQVDVHRAADRGLTRREREVLQLVAKSLSNREIAEQLFLSEATVKRHLTTTYAKLGARSRVEALATAYREGLIPQLG